jgi:uncharacterized membrane protein YdfJ with MMPL/SSD domain
VSTPDRVADFDFAAMALAELPSGKAIVTANATTCCGFLVLMFSNTAMLRNFAIVNALAISLVTLSLLTFMPALVTLFHVDNSRDQGSGISAPRTDDLRTHTNAS